MMLSKEEDMEKKGDTLARFELFKEREGETFFFEETFWTR